MTLSVGVIGTGVMGAEHVRILREETAGARVVAVCDADAERARAVAGDGEAFTDPLALIHDQRVQSVVIASPDATHADLALACLAAGKPVLCEKPLAATADQALRVVQAEVHLASVWSRSAICAASIRPMPRCSTSAIRRNWRGGPAAQHPSQCRRS